MGFLIRKIRQQRTSRVSIADGCAARQPQLSAHVPLATLRPRQPLVPAAGLQREPNEEDAVSGFQNAGSCEARKALLQYTVPFGVVKISKT
jgi:hypothetical protein